MSRIQATLLMAWWKLLEKRRQCSQIAKPTRSSITNRQISMVVQQNLLRKRVKLESQRIRTGVRELERIRAVSKDQEGMTEPTPTAQEAQLTL